MPDRTPPFTLEQIGTSAVRFPSSGPIPTIMDLAANPYSRSHTPKDIQVEAIQFWPQVKGQYPGLVVLHEAWGLNVQIKELANRLACEGYAVIVPNLYTRQGGMVTAHAEVAAGLMARVKDADVLQDINACCEFLNMQDYVKRNVHGVIGFGMGGTLALRFACQRKRLRGAVSFYGTPSAATGLLKDVLCPVLYHWAGADDTVRADDVEQLRRAAKEHGKRVEIKKYEGAPHAFCNNSRTEVYRADAASAAWEATVDFLQECFRADLQQPVK